MNNMIPPDGIEKCEDLCPCGAHLRLHTYTFKANTTRPVTKFYIDCESQCGRVTEWHETPEAAIKAFDREEATTVSNVKEV